MHRAEEEEERAASDRGGKSRAVYFWWGAALTFVSVFTLFLMLLVGLGLAVARILKGPRVHFVAYACGALIVVAVFLAYAMQPIS